MLSSNQTIYIENYKWAEESNITFLFSYTKLIYYLQNKCIFLKTVRLQISYTKLIYYLQNKCIFLKTVRLQISKWLKNVQIFQLSSIMLYRNNQTLAHIHTLKNFKTFNVTKQNIHLTYLILKGWEREECIAPN